MSLRPKPDLQDDEACMAAIAAGSTRAFKAVMDTYMRDIFRFSYSILSDAALAEDITQETFSRLWFKGSAWSSTGSLKSWLLRIAHNLCIDEIRKRRGHLNVDDVGPVLADKARGPRETLSVIETADTVQKAMFALPERQRAALMLVHYHERSNIEAAAIMELSVDAVESLLARGRRALKAALEDKKDQLLGE